MKIEQHEGDIFRVLTDGGETLPGRIVEVGRYRAVTHDWVGPHRDTLEQAANDLQKYAHAVGFRDASGSEWYWCRDCQFWWVYPWGSLEDADSKHTIHPTDVTPQNRAARLNEIAQSCGPLIPIPSNQGE